LRSSPARGQAREPPKRISWAQEGAKVIATDITFENVRKVVEEINTQHPGAALAQRHEVSSKEEWTKIVKAAVQAFGPITVLVNNAGILAPASYDQVTHEHWQKTMNINAWSQFAGIQTVAPFMKQAGVGSIINIASLAAINAAGRFTAYRASKGAINAFSRAAAIELAPFNIRVNCVNAGVIHTPTVDEAFPGDEVMKATLDAQPLGRLCREPFWRENSA
jgi:NAD(P)-dependent dehydrogenase (short-subunit alcohol dehydrogenase family)